MSKLEEIVQALGIARLSGELWIDGSFLTKKIDPKDVDLVFQGFVAPGKVDQHDPDHVRAINWLSSNLKNSHLCDSYICLQWPAGQSGNPEYWQRQFGLSRGVLAKGIAVIIIGGGL